MLGPVLAQDLIVLETIAADVTLSHLVRIFLRAFVIVRLQLIFAIEFNVADVAFKVWLFVQ